MLPGFTVNSHFFLTDEIELNLLPEEVNSREKADAVFALIKGIAQLLGRRFMWQEHGSAPQPTN